VTEGRKDKNMASKRAGVVVESQFPQVFSSPEANYVYGKILEAKAELTSIFPQRDEVIQGAMIGLLTRENVLLLGPPGTAKSALIRAIAEQFSATAQYFERLLSKFTTPEEIFGPLSLAALERDVFQRNVKGYLPTCYFAFLDEIFKANSAILNALLTIINEHVYSNGANPEPVPLVTMFAASNEMPESKTLDALFDRFIIRFQTEYLKRPSDFRRMIMAASTATQVRWNRVVAGDPVTTFDPKQANQWSVEPETGVMVCSVEYSLYLLELVQEYVKSNIVVNDLTLDALMDVRDSLKSAGFEISDRRWKKCITLLKANAFSYGESTTSPEDIMVLIDSLWADFKQRRQIADIVTPIASPAEVELRAALDKGKETLDKIITMRGEYVKKEGGWRANQAKFLGHISVAGGPWETMKLELDNARKTLAKVSTRSKPQAEAMLRDLEEYDRELKLLASGIGTAVLA
jgi:MoxR-like ATPase